MIFEKIKQIISEEFEIDENEISMNSLIVEDLGFDSNEDYYDLVMSLEDEFETELPDEALDEIKTIADLVKYIEEN